MRFRLSFSFVPRGGALKHESDFADEVPHTRKEGERASAVEGERGLEREHLRSRVPVRSRVEYE